MIAAKVISDKLLLLYPTLKEEDTLNFSLSLVNDYHRLDDFKEQLIDFLINLRKDTPKSMKTIMSHADDLVLESDEVTYTDPRDGMPIDHFSEDPNIPEEF